MQKVTDPKAKVIKPSIRFCPKIRQHEAGIDFVQSNGIKIKIGHMGYTAVSMEDEAKLLRAMETDAFCGITTWENRELPPEQKQSEAEVRKLTVENARMAEEMAALKEEMAGLLASKKG